MSRNTSDGRVSRATAQRLSQYLRCLGPAARVGGTVSSGELSKAVGVGDAQVRRDLAAIGYVGLRGVGYDAAGLATALRRVLGIDRSWKAVLVGAGNLARALVRYPGFRDQGFQIVGLFDTDPVKVGQQVEGLTVEPATAVRERVPALGAEIGVLAVPADAAQGAADQLVAAGVRGLLNFAPAVLRVPDHVQMLGVDLVSQFEQLAYLVQNENGQGLRQG
jgi:redox-sensing transcriptional repressor